MSARFRPGWRLMAAGLVVLMGGCFQADDDLRQELKALTKDLRGQVTPLGPAARLPQPAVPLTIDRNPFDPSPR